MKQEKVVPVNQNVKPEGERGTGSRDAAELTIRWSSRGSCGNAGCADAECVCSVCGKPIGIPEDSPRWDDHDDYCEGCEMCLDRTPPILFRGEGDQMQQAQFHTACFNRLGFATVQSPVTQQASNPDAQGGQ